MHHKDVDKILAAGFTIYRCSETEMLIKCQTAANPNWRMVSRHKTKKTLHHVRAALYNDPNAIQD